ncbi:MAG: exodeoxyribonuclease VII small subunit [Deltaproteobacteria bacterium]|nr:exodeoxyribonuclease VII small subunit [Deltaproteobacteria bacterium]
MTTRSQAQLPDDATFEQILDGLRSIVEHLEEGDLPLERSLEVFEEGIRLSRLGARRLDAAEKRIEELLQAEDAQTQDAAREPETVPLEVPGSR